MSLTRILDLLNSSKTSTRMTRLMSSLALRATLVLFFTLEVIPVRWAASTAPRNASLATVMGEIQEYKTADAPTENYRDFSIGKYLNNTSTYTATTTKRATEKPRLVMVVGPPKCATTTIQTYLLQLKDTLIQDGFFPEGGFQDPHKTFVQIPPLVEQLLTRTCADLIAEARENSQPVPDCWRVVTEELDAVYEAGFNMVMVSEGLGTMPFDMPAFLAATEKWHVEVIMLYRPFFSWLPSIKNQFEKGMGFLKEFPTQPCNSPLGFCCNDRHRPFRSAPLYRAIGRHGVDGVQCRFLKRYLYEPVRAFEQFHSTINTKIIDMRDNVVGTLFCNVLNAPTSCKAIQEMPAPKVNPSKNMDYHLIATTAMDAGILKVTDTRSRKEVVADIEQFHQTKLAGKPLPLECAEPTALEKLLDESLRLEQELVPQFYNESQHRAGFATAVGKNKYCSADVYAILKDPEWRKFFAEVTY